MPANADLARAADFMWRSARLVDRTRFAYFFANGNRATSLAALRAYQNDDGGFGHALEPDLRGPVSQPAHVRLALELFDSLDAFGEPAVKRACDYLLTITNADGGIPFALPSARPYPRGPWWETGDNPPSAITFTTPIVALLHKHQVIHPWLARATQYSWHMVDEFEVSTPDKPLEGVTKIGKSYEARALLTFLDHVPDRARAEKAFARIGEIVLAHTLVEIDPNAPGEVHTPLDYARSPHAMARRLFSDDVINAHLDALITAQQPDGSWMPNWLMWNPSAIPEWCGLLTVETLLLLQAYGRMPVA